MTTATSTEAQFCLPDRTDPPDAGGHDWSVACVEGPLTSYSLTPEQTATGGPSSLSGELEDSRAGAPSVTFM